VTPLAAVTKADVIERVVARCIASKTWRSACETEALAYASKAERQAVLAYVKAEYTIAGANFAGRWS
jgi:rubrerythrin